MHFKYIFVQIVIAITYFESQWGYWSVGLHILDGLFLRNRFYWLLPKTHAIKVWGCESGYASGKKDLYNTYSL